MGRGVAWSPGRAPTKSPGFSAGRSDSPAPAPAPGFVGALDSIVTPQKAVFSTRRLKASYVGSALQVRRASDNTTQNIGFTAGGDLDTTALAAFCGASAGFVATWYDQSGNAANLVQATAAAQPQIYTGAATNLIGTRAALLWDGVDDLLNVPVLAQAQPFMESFVARLTATTSASDFPILTGNSVANAATNTDIYMFQTQIYQKAPTDQIFQGDFLPNVNAQLLVNFAGAASYGRYNRVASAPADAGANALNGFRIGGGVLGMRMGEMVIFNGTLSAGNITAWEANQQTYWTIP